MTNGGIASSGGGTDGDSFVNEGGLPDHGLTTGCCTFDPIEEQRLRRRLGWIEVRDRYRAEGKRRQQQETNPPPRPVMVPRAVVTEEWPDLYFIGCESGPIKIGVSGDPAKRLKTLQTGYPYKLRLLAIVKEGCRLEPEYHARFAMHRLEGEWFERHPDILAEIDRLNTITDTFGNKKLAVQEKTK